LPIYLDFIFFKIIKPFADTGVTASINYIIGGYDRMDVKQKNKVVFGLGYSF
jgi:hypothetical protein